ncbi:MAG: glutathione S-transferase, partial [Gammaproteobacteria bacterium]|nr:glutathione S-transferase [Gammaproteobacteria bacterium]
MDLYTWSTPNGRKVSIMLEEVGLPYNVIPIDITNGDQHSDEFDVLSPNHKIPAIVDHEAGIHLMESGAILMYLANKTGMLMDSMEGNYWQQMEWLMLQMAHVGPMLGQTHHFVK